MLSSTRQIRPHVCSKRCVTDNRESWRSFKPIIRDLNHQEQEGHKDKTARPDDKDVVVSRLVADEVYAVAAKRELHRFGPDLWGFVCWVAAFMKSDK